MDQFIKPDDIVLLLDHYSLEGRNLRISFEKAGYRCPTVVVEDDGFLPDDVLSVYGFFLGNFAGEKGVPGRPKYFNQIVVPDYWEISGNNSVGSICDLIRERGRIFYAEPPHKRLVKVVDWYDENGVVRSSDHYNRYGALYARTAFDAKGKRVNKSWFAASGREIIVENYVTDGLLVSDDNEYVSESPVEILGCEGRMSRKEDGSIDVRWESKDCLFMVATDTLTEEEVLKVCNALK